MKQLLEQLLDSYSSMDCRHNMAGWDCPSCQISLDRNNPQFFDTSLHGFGIGYPNLLEHGDYHETYKVDRYDNVYDGHGTIRASDGWSKRLCDFDREIEKDIRKREEEALRYAKSFTDKYR